MIFGVFPPELPRLREERWALLDRILADWFAPPDGVPPLSASDLDLAERRLALSLPLALRDWYLRYGRRQDV